MAGTLALIDGDHHPDAVRDALRALEAEEGPVVGAVFCGGGEKLAPEVLADPATHYGVPVLLGDPAASLRELAAAGAGQVVDLADEPALGPAAKLELACVALDLGLSYRGADFELRPPARERLDLGCPALAVIGTGKRTGKTAVCGHWARLLVAAGRRPLIVAMGRGGPAVPQRAAAGTSLEDLLALARAGAHAASDYLEDAVLAGVPTVGCRRVGGGLAGASVVSNVVAGARLAAEAGPGTILFEGSGAAVPPVAVDATVCVVGSREAALEHLGPYRLLRSALALVAPDDPALAEEVGRWCAGPAIRFALVPEPAGEISPGERVALFSTSPAPVPGVEAVVASSNLARRAALAGDLERAAAERCDVYLTELKAAAVDTVAEAAAARGARVVFLRNRPVARPGEPDLDAALGEVHRRAEEAAA